MDIELTDAHEEFRASVRGLLAERSPMARVRALIESDTGYDAETWSAMADQLGLQGLIVPEQYGGSGFGFVELAVALEETGRALVCAPLLATVFATLAIIHSGDEQAAKQQLPAIAAGDTIAALALADDSAQWPPHPDSLLAHPNGDGYVLKGHRSYVVDGLQAALIVATATTDAQPALYLVEARDVSRAALPVSDQTRRLARIEFDNTPAVQLAGDGVATLSNVLDLARVALAAEQLGGARRCMEATVDYVLTRRQFGRQIGSFQAIKHRLADTLMDIENATAAVRYACACAAGGSDELALAAPLTSAHCSEVYTRAAGTMLQLHGGIGFTWEHDAHLFLKRAKSSELLLGSPAYLRELLAQRAGF